MFYKGKRVLVTGGTGFVGTHIVEELLKQGANVRITVHKRAPVIQEARIETVPVDLTQQDECVRAATGIDYVFHAAGAVAAAGVMSTNPMAAISSNLILTVQMLQAAWTANVERFLIFSSSTAYPPADYPIREEELWERPTYPFYFGYGWMRRYFERLGEFVASKSDVQIAIVRPTAVYGRWDNFNLETSHVIPALIRKAVEKVNPYEVWGTGDEVRDFLHVSDLARGCLLMLEKCANCDPVNIGYGKAITIREIVSTILAVAGHSEANIVFNSSKPTAIPFRMVDTSKAKRLLNFEPAISLDQGIRDTVEWFAAQSATAARGTHHP